jgi:predicted O-methyltransferase YrrM
VINAVKQSVKRGLKLPIKVLRRYQARRTLAQLISHRDPTLQAIGFALQESLTNDLSVEEQESVSSIEKRRSLLLGSDKEIAFVDYGAGSRNSNRTKEVMEEGVQSTRIVADITKASKPAFWATVLFKIIRKLEPQSCVELGSCVGISASYQASALVFNGKGTIVTLEGSPDIAEVAAETFKVLGFENASVVTGPFHETLDGVLEACKPIDFFFNDGHHDHDALMQYFDQAMPYLSDCAVIVFDDITWSTGMRKAWAEIESDKRVSASIDVHDIGIAVLKKNMATKVKFRIPLRELR